VSNDIDTKVLQILGCDAEKPARTFSDDDGVRLGTPLQPRRKVRRLADDAPLLRLTRTDQVANHHKASSDADAGLKQSTRFQPTHRLDQLQPRPDGSLGVVLMGLRIPEVDQYAVAHVLRYEPTETLHGLCDRLLIRRNDLAQVLWVHARSSAKAGGVLCAATRCKASPSQR
jgi:hypothetical protein